MSPPIQSVESVGAVPPVASRQVRSEPAQDPQEAVTPTPENTRQAVVSALRDGGNKIQFGTHSAQFSYDDKTDRVIVRIYSSDTAPREVIRQIPPEDYLAFVTRFREMFGVLIDQKR